MVIFNRKHIKGGSYGSKRVFGGATRNLGPSRKRPGASGYMGGKHEATEFMIGGLQIGTPIANQKWVDDFLASRRQGLSERTLEFYRDILYQFVGIDLTAKGINDWLTNLNCGNAKFSYYRAVKAFCNWLYKSKKIAKNPIVLVDRPKTSKRLLPAITKEQLEILVTSLRRLSILVEEILPQQGRRRGSRWRHGQQFDISNPRG